MDLKNGGNITLSAAQDIIINYSSVATDAYSSTGTSGTIQFTSNAGSIDTRKAELTSVNTAGGNAGNIIFRAAQNILTRDVK